ncbi:MAG: hypothetical protein E6J91_40765 [Deltaproteobacteria bacterium]|nr:MAG: hypothetical protein E6J91_40765 [Deltaproteobacteria bacterium]
MKRGDQYAQAQMWDKAAAEYQTAQRLEPDNPDVAIKLRQVAQKRAGERLTRARSLIARGEIEAGLTVIQDAVRLDPGSTDAQQALDDANQQVLARAEELLATPEAQRALELTQLVLAGSPRDPRARAADEHVRDALAEQSYAQAEQFATAGKKGNALIAYAASMTFRPSFRDARAQIGDVKLALQQELTFHVVLDRFATTGPGDGDIAAHLRPELVAQAFDDHLPLRVVGSPPAPTARGVRVTGALSAYRFGPERVTSRNDQCDYIRGYDTVPNPARADAERQVNNAEQRLGQAEREVDQEQKEIDRYQRDVDDTQRRAATTTRRARSITSAAASSRPRTTSRARASACRAPPRTAAACGRTSNTRSAACATCRLPSSSRTTSARTSPSRSARSTPR